MPSEPLRVLSVIPPMTQLNTPYPSTAYLTGFLRSRGYDAVQDDLALALVLRLFSAPGLAGLAHTLATTAHRSPVADAFVAARARYQATIGPVIAFLRIRSSVCS